MITIKTKRPVTKVNWRTRKLVLSGVVLVLALSLGTGVALLQPQPKVAVTPAPTMVPVIPTTVLDAKSHDAVPVLVGAPAAAVKSTETLAVGDSSGDVLAAAILEKAGVRAGVCELPRVGGGILAAAMARAGIAQVHGLAPDVKAADAARKPSVDCGVLGSQVVIETGLPRAIPLGDWVADLLVVADATDGNLKDLPSAEIRRVLAPYRGTAVVGQPAGMGGLSHAGLSTWAKEVDAGAKVTEDATGLWAVIRMPALVGGDDWTHHMHGADGDLVSNDKVFGTAPFELQWTNKPHIAGNWDVHVISAGRMFSAQSSVFQHPDLPYELVARSAYNGQVLWRRPIAQDFGEAASLVIATPEKLYLKDKNKVLVLDPETGKELNQIVAYKDETQQCLLLLLSDGVLLTLTGPVQRYGGEAQDFNASPAKLKAQDETNELYEGRELIAWDAANGKELWRFQDEKIDPSKLVVNAGHIYFYAQRTYAACLNLRTGTQSWKTDAPIAEPRGPGMGFNGGHATVKMLSLQRNGAIATKDVYFINYLPHRHCQAFAAADGHILWDKMRGPSGDDPKKTNDFVGWHTFYTPVVLGTTIYERENYQKPSDMTELLSGNSITSGAHVKLSGCGRFTAVSSGLLIGQNGEVCDINTHKNILDCNAKSTCGSAQFVADGLLFKMGASCGGCTEWRGFFTSRSVPKHDVRTGERRETGTAGESAYAVSDPSDWTTYRGDDTRKGSSTATIVATAAIRWTFTPHFRPFGLGAGGEYLMPDVNPTQPIAVGERIWVGTAEGAVVCLDRKTGGEVWRHWTAGRIWTSPTWWQGRIYVGSCDGWVYCLDAATGALAWRYRVAPEERRVMILGRMSSAWPIMGNVVVQDGTAYALGGLVGQLGGSELCALDAKTGAVRWDKHFGISASGQLAWYEGHLWWHVGDLGLFIVDPATGEVRPAVSGLWINWAASRGQDIGILPGGWVVFGGRQFNLPPGAREQWSTVCGFLRADADGPPKDAKGAVQVAMTRLDKAHSFDAMPVWDAKEVLLFGKPAGYQGGASTMASTPLRPVFCRNLGVALTAEADARFTDSTKPGGQAYKPEWSSNYVPPADQMRNALPDGFGNGEWNHMNAVLGANAVVLFYNTTVFAVSRTDGKELWRVNLPSSALPNGMSLTRAGDVLVSLIDGRVVCIGAPPLIEALHDDCGIEIKNQQELDKPSAALAPALIKLLNHPNEMVVLQSAEALQRINQAASTSDDLLAKTLGLPETLDALAKGFKSAQPAVRSECLSLLETALRSAPNKTAAQQFAPLLSQLLEHDDNQAVRVKAFAVLAAIDPENETLARNLNLMCSTSKTGVIPQWLALGPIPISGADAQGHGLDVEQIPGQAALAPASGERVTIGERSFKWKMVNGDENGIIDGAATLGAAENVAMYLITYVNAAHGLTGLRLSWGSDDSAVVYVNGQEVSRYIGGRPYAPDQNVAENVTLQKGANTIMMKILNGSGGYGGCMRILDADKKPCVGLPVIPVRIGRKADTKLDVTPPSELLPKH